MLDSAIRRINHYPSDKNFGLVHARYSLPEWQAAKLTFFAACFHTALIRNLSSNRGELYVLVRS